MIHIKMLILISTLSGLGLVVKFLGVGQHTGIYIHGRPLTLEFHPFGIHIMSFQIVWEYARMGYFVVMDSIGGFDGKEFMGIIGKYHFTLGIDHGSGIALVDYGDPIVEVGEPVRIDIDHIRRDLAPLDMVCMARGYWGCIFSTATLFFVLLFFLLGIVLFLEKVPYALNGSLNLIHGFL